MFCTPLLPSGHNSIRKKPFYLIQETIEFDTQFDDIKKMKVCLLIKEAEFCGNSFSSWGMKLEGPYKLL